MKYEVLKLENQLCFPLYAASKEVVKRYRPYLDEIGLTYTQYITMMVLWEHKTVNVKTLGSFLHLDSGTLTPLLKKLEAKGYLTRKRSDTDERKLEIRITEGGEALNERAQTIPTQLASCLNLSSEEVATLYGLLYKMLEG
ncbi:MAG: MarR family transcriptional regulator [Coriobacteriales bacterium]|jgi:DNA-binding MarR family transcriptional regulator|nr:MarR family transcriptional regulator [Coriobacteriales bacterium]